MNIYLDTVVWNRLCDQGANPSAVLSCLATHNCRLTFGAEVVYELARTFYGIPNGSAERGKKLFSYLKHFVQSRVPCVRMGRDILSDEANIAVGSLSYPPQIFLNEADQANLLKEVARLSLGILTEGADQFIRDRKQLSETARQEMAHHYKSGLTRNLLPKMADVSLDELGRWMAREMRGKGRHVLRGHLAELFQRAQHSELSLRQLMWVSKRLLSYPKYRLANAMTRADLYANWRFARSGSLSRDIPSDLYHIVNAAYCDIYATCESGQEKYAPSIIPKTRVALYPNDMPIERWIRQINTPGY